jgi:hypothetical protein
MLFLNKGRTSTRSLPCSLVADMFEEIRGIWFSEIIIEIHLEKLLLEYN